MEPCTRVLIDLFQCEVFIAFVRNRFVVPCIYETIVWWTLGYSRNILFCVRAQTLALGTAGGRGNSQYLESFASIDGHSLSTTAYFCHVIPRNHDFRCMSYCTTLFYDKNDICGSFNNKSSHLNNSWNGIYLNLIVHHIKIRCTSEYP